MAKEKRENNRLKTNQRNINERKAAAGVMASKAKSRKSGVALSQRGGSAWLAEKQISASGGENRHRREAAIEKQAVIWRKLEAKNHRK